MITSDEIRAVLDRSTYFENTLHYGVIQKDGSWSL